jgi:pyruvate, water dikinase
MKTILLRNVVLRVTTCALLMCAGAPLACTSSEDSEGSPPYPDAGSGPSSDGGAPLDDGGTGPLVDGGAAPDTDGGLPQTDGGAASPPDGGAVPPHDGGALPPGDAGSPPSPGFLSELTSLRDFTTLAAEGIAVKFLLGTDVEELPAPLDTPCTFQDTARFPYHLQFLRSLPGLEDLSNPSYESWAMYRETRRFYAGVVELLPTAIHPGTSASGVLAYTVYTAQAPGELLGSADIISIDEGLRSCVGPLAELLVYVPATSAELAAARADAETLAAGGVSFAGRDELRPDTDVEVYSAGEGYGYLRRLTPEQALDEAGPRDVVVTDTAPSDLGLVAALITNSAQSSVSHLNLRLQEKRIPNARAANFHESSLSEQLEGELVHVTADDGELQVQPTTLEAAEAYWATQRGEPKTPEGDTSTTAMPALSSLRHTDALSYGVKAANLGELGRALPEANHPAGIALPFAAYLEHIESNDLGESVASTIAAAEGGGEAARAALELLRDAIRAAPVAESFERRFHAAVERQWGPSGFTTRLRFRSSTNVEDLPGISGAGLYESASGCIADDLDEDEDGPSLCLTDEQRAIYEAELERRQAEFAAYPDRAHLPDLIEDLEDELTKEKSARRALRKVWASLWSERAFEDRQYHGIVHQAAYMGIAVHPALVGEQLEAVAITNLDSGGDVSTYRVASQLGEVGVARPVDPTAVAELLTFDRGTDDAVTNVTLLQTSSLVEAGTSLWSEERLAELGRLLFVVQDHFETEVYPDISPLELDVEVDVAADGRILVKQARPFVGVGP